MPVPQGTCLRLKSQHLGNKDDGVNRRKGHRKEYAPPGPRFILTGQHKGKVITHDAHTLVPIQGRDGVNGSSTYFVNVVKFFLLCCIVM